ncbi:tRNA (guanosine(46)-N7)-methyltransferase TrmB [Hyphococcus flavus]|uniref:tRNA (guanine-N(7)-)-methyltransferase n=1 Tax=Hyphococcus flavus TaxID=1866326 RepID=A0AAE9ZCY2_9PROT|nr:tRNA (guanosine(46)-N7)-methyltransferase TrmB [Hyphococcus flavus]WDI32663.1 tRNA (guanosine(46)-N7)-methyltransferase TrmB [Hyphococcus flavus]
MTDTKYIPRLYGRQQDKPLKPRQARLMESLLPRIAMPDPEAGALDLSALFPQAEEIQLEVGFGGGEHLAWQAAHNPEAGFIGAEPFVNGVGKLLSAVDDAKLGNVRIHFGDARPLIEALPGASLSRIYVLHPDPWPKKRHHKRRMVSPWFFEEAARLIKPGGELRIASDIRDYIRWTLMHARNAEGFEWTAECASDWKIRPDDWPQTRYEAKSIREGRKPCYLQFRRL